MGVVGARFDGFRERASARVGRYRAVCEVPGRLLRQGAYFVSAGAFIENKENIDWYENLLGFTVSPVGCPAMDNRVGVICPVLSWRVDFTENRMDDSDGIGERQQMLAPSKETKHDVSAADLRFYPFSFRDPNGRLFERDGELYRGITARRSDLYRRLFQDGVVSRLVDRGLLVETEISPLAVEGYDLVLRHKRVPFISYCFKWTPRMLRDAAILTLDLLAALSEAGLGMEDIHAYNVLFDGPRPVHVDFGAIEPLEDLARPWLGLETFRQYFVYPLRLLAAGHGRAARWLLHDFDHGILKTDFPGLCRRESLTGAAVGRAARSIAHRLSSRTPDWLRRLIHQRPRLHRSVENDRLIGRALARLRREVESISLRWRRGNGRTTTTSVSCRWRRATSGTPSTARSDEALMRWRPVTVFDIGCNRGWFSQLAATCGSHVVSVDIVEPSVELLYADAREKRLPIVPLVMDVKNPSPAYGLSNQWMPPATKRFRSNLVIALALTHHLALRDELRLDEIASSLSCFSKRWLVTKFVGREDHWASACGRRGFPTTRWRTSSPPSSRISILSRSRRLTRRTATSCFVSVDDAV